MPFILVLSTYVLRVLVVIKSNNNFDAYGHLYFTNLIRDKSAGPFTTVDTGILCSAKLANPFVWHWLVSKIPKILVHKFNKHFNSLLDAVYCGVIFWVCKELGLSSIKACEVCALYILSPIFFSKLNIGPRLFFTPRLFSEFITNLFFILTILPLDLSQDFKIIAGAICVFLVLGSSKFGIQVILFMTPLVCLLEKNLIPLLSFSLGFLFILTLSRFSFLTSIKSQVSHLIWYFKNNLKGNMPISKRNNLRRIFSYDKDKSLQNNFLQMIIRLVQDHSISSLILKFPCVLIYFFLLFESYKSETFHVLGSFHGPVYAGMILFTLISLPLLLFLGEAERYINHISFFVILGIVLMCEALKMEFVSYLLLLYGFLYYCLEICFLKDKRAASQHAQEKILSFLNNQTAKIKLVIYPFHAVSIWRVMLETSAKVLYPLNVLPEKKKMITEHFCPEYPFTDLNLLDEMASDVGINLVVIDKGQLSTNLPGWKNSTHWEELDLGGQYYSVFSRKGLEVIL